MDVSDFLAIEQNRQACNHPCYLLEILLPSAGFAQPMNRHCSRLKKIPLSPVVLAVDKNRQKDKHSYFLAHWLSAVDRKVALVFQRNCWFALVAGVEKADWVCQMVVEAWKIRQRGWVGLTGPEVVPIVVLQLSLSRSLVMMVLHPRMYRKKAGGQNYLIVPAYYIYRN